MDQQYQLIGEVAKVLGCGPANVRLLVESGKIPAIRTARGVRLFAAEDVRKFANERRVEQRAKR
jgi:excisionase family DNA binding protein